jgi:glutamate carboxypeptidase
MEPLSARHLDVLRAWVNQNSHTDNSEGVRKIQASAHEEAFRLGLTLQWVPSTLSNAPHQALYGTKGNGPKHVAMVCHADTVFPIDSPFQTCTEHTDHWTGPGIIDDKGGILVTLLAIEQLLAAWPATITLHWVCMPTEETGSQGYHAFLADLGRKVDLVLGFEPALPDGSIIASRRGNQWFQIDIRGRGGHAGRDATTVLNPALEATLVAGHASDLSNEASRTSVTVTGLETNSPTFNTIPSTARVKIDGRFEDSNEGERVLSAMQTIGTVPFLKPKTAKIHPLEKTLKVLENCPAFSRTPNVNTLAEFAVETIQKIEGIAVEVCASGGSADANYMSRPGLAILDGLGPRGSGMHTEQERLEVKSLKTRADVAAKLLAHWAGL